MEKFSYPRLGELCYLDRLENGMTVCVVPRSGYWGYHACLAVACGGMDRRAAMPDGTVADFPPGTAHALARALFHCRGGVLDVLAALGIEAEVRSAPDLTFCRFSCAHTLESALRTLLRQVLRPELSPERLAREQRRILRETGPVPADPDQVLWANLLCGLYARHPIRDASSGAAPHLSAATPQELLQCCQALYCPGNMVLCVLGDVDPRRIFSVVRMVQPEGTRRPARRILPEDEPSGAASRFHQVEIRLCSPRTLLGCKAPAPPEGGAGLRQLLTGDLAARLLSGALAEDRGWAVQYHQYPGAAFLTVGGADCAAEELRGEVLEEAGRLMSALDGAHFTAVRRAAYGQRLLALDHAPETALHLARACLSGAQYYDWADLYDEIGPEEVRALLRAAVCETAVSLSVVRPKGGTV